MKSIFTILLALVFSNEIAKGQVWTGSTTNTGCINHDGPVSMNSGISTTTIGPAWFGYGTGYMGFNIARNTCSGSSGVWNTGTDGANNGASVIWGSIGGDILFSTYASTGSSSGSTTDADVLSNIKFSIRNNGTVIIGENQWTGSWYSYEPTGYKLYVQEGIITEKLKVAIKGSSDWSDYVFKPEYNLLPLEKVEEYIKINHHLPNVPSAEDVTLSGIDVAKMDAKLLEKIEELTLYLLQLKKDNSDLKSRVDILEKTLK